MSSTARTEFDAVIVGGGVAGSTTAIVLARAGWSVALIERQRFPRRKVCGECIAASNLPLLHALGIGDAFDRLAGAALREVTLLRGDHAVSAGLPPAGHGALRWGRALGRETLDGLLLDAAQGAGTTVFQPWTLRRITGRAGQWSCELRDAESTDQRHLQARVVIDAHGSWEHLPSDRPQRRLRRSGADLFAFKANFHRSALADGAISVLAFDGGYGGMVVADGGTTTVACCIRRDRLAALRAAAPGARIGDAVEAWLQQQNSGVRRALQGAARDGSWLTSGPLDPGIRIAADDSIFKVGNAAGEAHPILGEGISMALQSALLLGDKLIAGGGVPDANRQADIARAYAAAWRRAFAPRLRLAAAFAHAAMRPGLAVPLLALCRLWPGLLTRGARWGGKTRAIDLASSPGERDDLARRLASDSQPATRTR